MSGLRPLALVCVLVRTASAEPPATTAQAPPSFSLPAVVFHGFVSEGGFVSTSNEFIGRSSRGSLELFEAGINMSTELTDRLRAGVQLFGRNVGAFDETSARIDWAFLDYRLLPGLGLRAGVIKMPFGLYNEYTDVDAARLPILMPQSLYPLRNRDVLLAHTGFTLYGDQPMGRAGSLEYQAWFGSLTIPRSALELQGATLDGIDTRYVAGGQVFWRPPLDGLRVGGTYLRTSIDFNLVLDPATVEQLVTAELVPADFDGGLVVSQRPTWLWATSVEYLQGDWLFAAEYSRWLKHQQTTLPDLIPAFDEDAERFYAMATYRLSQRFESGGYYSVTHADADDRLGRDPRFVENFHAYQRDLAATLRFDVNANWLWKLEAHFVDGTAELSPASNPDPDRFWGLFLIKTTVAF
jgi:hypothetical protein